MPTLYRIGCLRDDVIFFIFLYQRYVYPIDKTRVNEFGLTGEPADEVAATTTETTKEVENEEQPASTEVTEEAAAAGEASTSEDVEETKKDKWLSFNLFPPTSSNYFFFAVWDIFWSSTTILGFS